MIDFSNFYQLIAKSPLSHWLETLPAQVAAWQREALHGKFREWERAVEFLPELTPWRLDLLHSVTAESETPLSEGHQLRVENLLKNLMPWRKGPYSLYGINIDTEWRSDWKWERVLARFGFPPENGSPPSRTCPILPGGLSSTWAAAAAITCGE